MRQRARYIGRNSPGWSRSAERTMDDDDKNLDHRAVQLQCVQSDDDHPRASISQAWPSYFLHWFRLAFVVIDITYPPNCNIFSRKGACQVLSPVHTGDCSRRIRRLSPKTATVAEFGDKLSPFPRLASVDRVLQCKALSTLSRKSATVAEFGDSWRFLRQSHFFATVWTGLNVTLKRVSVKCSTPKRLKLYGLESWRKCMFPGSPDMTLNCFRRRGCGQSHVTPVNLSIVKN